MEKQPMSKTKFAFILLGFMFLAYAILSILYPEHSDKFAKGFQVLWTCVSIFFGGPVV